AVRRSKPHAITFKDDGSVPNNSRLPFLLYRGAVALGGSADPAALLEELFNANDWGDSWRNGIYDYVHYHSRTHEVLGIARGHGLVRFGGNDGKIIELRSGDVVILPAGTGHQLISGSKQLLVVGAYPPSGTYDECMPLPEDHKRALKSIPKVPLPAKDPVYGKNGPLQELWPRP
ncbi:MAG: cupin domain-containing protein, partial [Xanthobacteraceae bacterium]